MLGLSHFEILGPRHRRMGVDQVHGVEKLAAIVALVAAGFRKPAVRACALNVAVRQKSPVGVGIHLFFRDFADQPLFVQNLGKGLGQLVVLGTGRPSEMVERQPETITEVCLNLPHLGTILRDGFARLCSGQFSGCAMFVGGAEKQNLMPPSAQIARVEVGGQLRADEVSKVLDPVDVGDRGSDQMPGHGMRPVSGRLPLPPVGDKNNRQPADQRPAQDPCRRINATISSVTTSPTMLEKPVAPNSDRRTSPVRRNASLSRSSASVPG